MRIILTHWSVFFILLARLHSVRAPGAPGPSRKNELNLSKVTAEPIVFWPIQTSKHNLPTEKRLAYLHSVPLTSGPTINAGTLDALEFLEGSKSFTFIPNNGSMNGEMAMCWMLLLYLPNSAWPQSSVLLAYEGTNGLPGFELGISPSGTLMAGFYDMDGTKFALTSSISLEPSKWLFTGINFNMLWKDNQFDFFLIDHEVTDPIVTKDTHSLGSTDTLRLNAHGSIILGANHVDRKHFVGKMACIQFYNTSIIGGTQKEAVGLCDPNMWSHADYGEYTIDASSETTTQRTTTTPPTTTQRTTTTTPTTTTTTQRTTTPTTTQRTTTREPTTTTLSTTTQPKTTFTTTKTPTTTTLSTTTQPKTTFTTTKTPTTTTLSTTTQLKTTFTTTKTPTTTTLSTTTQPKTTFTTRQPNNSQQQTTAQLNPTGCSTDDICRCVDIELNEEELADKIKSLKEKLLVNKETTSMMIRTKTCAEDERASAKVIGQCGLAVLIVVTGFLVLQDMVTVLRKLFSLFRHFFHTNNQVSTVAEGTIKADRGHV